MLGARADILEDLTQAANQEHGRVKDVTPDDKLTLEGLLDWAYTIILIPNIVLQLLAKGINYLKDLKIANCTIINDRLHYQNCIYVSGYYMLHLCFCYLYHDNLIVSYLGVSNIYDLLHRSYYWPNI